MRSWWEISGAGWIAAFNGFTHEFIGFLKDKNNSLITIDGLWSLTFGNDANAGPANTLFFAAGINNENDGLFGTLTPINGLDGDEESGPPKVFSPKLAGGRAEEFEPLPFLISWGRCQERAKQTRDRAATHLQPQLQHLALDFLRSPMRILPCKA